VAYPYAGNIGGGGFMVYRKNDGEIGALDYREKAPLAATRDMYLDKEGNIIKGKSTVGATAVGVPGTVAGVFKAQEKFGLLSVKEILSPVIALAKKGVIVTKKQEDRIKKFKKAFETVNSKRILFLRDWKEGDIIKYKALAITLERISKNGRDEFYKGKTAKVLAQFIQDNGGIITEEDLAKYEAKWRTPVTFEYDGLKVISMSPPSSGGVCLAQIMNGIESYDLHTYGHNSLKSMQVITEAERRAYADRSYFLGDPDFVSIPTDTLLSKTYSKERMRNFSFEKPTLSKDISHGNIEIIESDETTHYSIVDQFGNAVSVIKPVTFSESCDSFWQDVTKKLTINKSTNFFMSVYFVVVIALSFDERKSVNLQRIIESLFQNLHLVGISLQWLNLFGLYYLFYDSFH
ncbi:gamma-glutamyltransferase, partial [Flavobacteriaceae bacterium]|nr:gamma-glutamyltransferase [Flavobacteriaceae bacterium]